MHFEEETTTFIPAQKPVVNSVFPVPAIVATPSQKSRLKAAKNAFDDELFECSYIPESSSEIESVCTLISSHKQILSQTKRTSKVFDETFLRLQQLQKGEFLYAYTWEQNWFTRVNSKFPLQKLQFENIIQKIDEALLYVEERQKYGYWYPSKRNGKMQKPSLAAFIASQTKAGTYWSPFLEICCDNLITPKMLRDSLGENACKILDEIQNNVWFHFDFNTSLKFYRSVADLKKWHSENVETLCIKNSQNKYHLSSFLTLLDGIKRCNVETGCVGPNFIGPWSSRWSVFVKWFKNVNGVEI